MAFNFKRGVNAIGRYLSKHQSAIFTGIACAGVVTSVVIAATQHIKADEILNEAKDELDDLEKIKNEGEINDEEYEGYVKTVKIRTIKELAVVYAPVVLSTSLTITTIVLSHKSHMRVEAVLTSALNSATTLLGDYKAEVKKILKPKQYNDMEQSVKEKMVKRNPPPNHRQSDDTKRRGTPSEDVIHETGLGTQLMMLEKTGAYFRCSEDNLNKLLYHKIQQPAICDGYRLFNDLEWELKIPQSGYGSIYGWEDRQFINSCDMLYCNVTYVNHTDPRTGTKESCGVISFNIDPIAIKLKEHEKDY